LFPAAVFQAMHSVGSRQMADAPVVGAPSPATVRIVYNAVRTLVPEAGTLRLRDLLAVTRLEPEPAAAAMRRLAREGPVAIRRLAADEPTWVVRRTDRVADRREATGRASGEWAVERSETDGRASGEGQRAESRVADRMEATGRASGEGQRAASRVADQDQLER
jgi:hypothetical protein